MKTIIDAFVIDTSCISGSKVEIFNHIAYLDEGVANKRASSYTEEWTDYKVRPVKVRILNDEEGAVGWSLVSINRENIYDLKKEAALKKLTKEERELLNI